jgi:hypothetical protein
MKHDPFFAHSAHCAPAPFRESASEKRSTPNVIRIVRKAMVLIATVREHSIYSSATLAISAWIKMNGTCASEVGNQS